MINYILFTERQPNIGGKFSNLSQEYIFLYIMTNCVCICTIYNNAHTCTHTWVISLKNLHMNKSVLYYEGTQLFRIPDIKVTILSLLS